MFRAVFWVILPCKMIVDRRFRGAYCLHVYMYNPEDSSEHHTRRRENLKSHKRSRVCGKELRHRPDMLITLFHFLCRPAKIVE
jgi:hypothetical protein